VRAGAGRHAVLEPGGIPDRDALRDALLAAVAVALLVDPAREPVAVLVAAELVTVLLLSGRREPHGAVASVISDPVL
jgi:hypothetical protein